MTERTRQFDWDAWCARRRELEERGFFDSEPYEEDGEEAEDDDET